MKNEFAFAEAVKLFFCSSSIWHDSKGKVKFARYETAWIKSESQHSFCAYDVLRYGLLYALIQRGIEKKNPSWFIRRGFFLAYEFIENSDI